MSTKLVGKKRKTLTAQEELEIALQRQEERVAKKPRSEILAAAASTATTAVQVGQTWPPPPQPQASPGQASPAPALSAKEQMKERLRAQRLQLQAQHRQLAKSKAGGVAAAVTSSTGSTPAAIHEAFQADDPEEDSAAAAAADDRRTLGAELYRPEEELQQQQSQAVLTPCAEEEPLSPSPPEDPAERQLVEHLVSFIQKQGPGFEHVVRTKNQDNPQFAWLFDRGSAGYRYYQYQLGRPASEWALPRSAAAPVVSPASSVSPPSPSPIPQQPPPPPPPPQSQAVSTGSPPTAPRPAEDSVEAMNAFIARLQEANPERAAEGQWVQDRIRERSARLDEVRAGRRHIGDYLPAEEFNKLLTKAHHKSGAGPALLDEDRPQIAEDNRGFQMLRRMGWEEDQGLGRQNHGRLAPVRATGGNNQLGIGARAPGEIAVDPNDDEFTLYKKRMALSYRHRPNPNNAPRTPYWENEKMNQGASQL